MGYDMSTLNLNYDNKYDILYARLSDYTPSYGDEENGIVTYYSIETDSVTGMAIYNVKKKIQNGEIDSAMLPIPINLDAAPIQELLYRPENGYRCTLRLA